MVKSAESRASARAHPQHIGQPISAARPLQNGGPGPCRPLPPASMRRARRRACRDGFGRRRRTGLATRPAAGLARQTASACGRASAKRRVGGTGAGASNGVGIGVSRAEWLRSSMGHRAFRLRCDGVSSRARPARRRAFSELLTSAQAGLCIRRSSPSLGRDPAPFASAEASTEAGSKRGRNAHRSRVRIEGCSRPINGRVAMRTQTSDATCAACCTSMGRLAAAECVPLSAAGCGSAEPRTAQIGVWS
jgi:hypothetical protein